MLNDDYVVFNPEDHTLSEYVQDYVIGTWDTTRNPNLSREDRAEVEEVHKMVDELVDGLVKSREMLTDTDLFAIEKLVANAPEFLRHKLDERFTRDLIEAVPGYVERMMRLSRLEGARVPSNTTNTYLQEAARTYIFGFPLASVALSRAALEQALKESLARQLSADFITFQELLKEARRWKILDGPTEHMARDVANAGDEVMHERPTDLSQARDILTKVRGLIEHIYSVEGRF